MPLRRKHLFRPPPPAPTTIYVRPGYNRVLAEEFEALKVKRVALVAVGRCFSPPPGSQMGHEAG